MEHSVKAVEFQLYEDLVQLQKMLEVMELDPALTERLEECKELIRTKRYRVAVMGEFKRGKSTLINAMLGLPVLPADATPTTATVNRITYGVEERAVVRFRDGREQEIPVDRLADYVTKLTEEGRAVSETVQETVLYYPSVICQNHIEIIDTPGLNDEREMTRITLETLPQVDAVIMPIHARVPFSSTERDFVCQMLESKNIDDIIFVMTFLDQLDEDDYVYEDYVEAVSRRIRQEVFGALEERRASEEVLRKAHRVLDQVRLSGVSASQALKSFVSNQKKLLAQSHFEGFLNDLKKTLAGRQMECAVWKAAAGMEWVVTHLEEAQREREGFFRREEDRLREMQRRTQRFFGDFSQQLEELFRQQPDVMELVLEPLRQEEEKATAAVIRALSGVRVAEHMAVFQAINPVILQIPEQMHDCWQQQLKPMLLSRLAQVLEQISVVGNQDGVDEPLMKEYGYLLQEAEDTWTAQSFVWVDGPYPNVPDLAHCNFIRYFRPYLQRSVQAMAQRIVDTAEAVKGRCCAQLPERNEPLRERLAQRQQEQYRQLDGQRRAYEQNLDNLRQTVNQAWSNTQALLREWEDGPRVG